MIFISYARADAAAAHRLAAELLETGVPSLMDPPLPQGDVFWRDRLATQMAPCAVMAALDSPAADASPWVQQERRGFAGAGGVLHGRADGAPGFVTSLRAAWRRHATNERPDPLPAAPDTDTDRIARANADDLALARWQAAHPPHAKAANRDGDRAWLADDALALRAVPGQPGWYLALAPLSNAVYRRFVAASGRPPPATWARPSFAAPDLPATGMTWHDAAACAAWLGGELPPERVWHAAALAGGTGGEFATIDGGICARRAHHGQAFASGAPRAADAYPATPAGFSGLCGNTWDWCADSWPAKAGQGAGPARRVIRGGGWMDDARFCRIDARYRNAAIDPDASVGLRLAWRAAGDAIRDGRTPA
ncbi:MAG: SUMF1/EgtB/PvdO family nonheme iron enzyme [Burkholderiaceae bacterium]|nr:SUMF1/EgtB/PvdO family nonheme iron enzyme [Burkholderiaceae bacterium]